LFPPVTACHRPSLFAQHIWPTQMRNITVVHGMRQVNGLAGVY
jgi:hypothetical protein